MKFALITGATKGIGKAVAESLLLDGYHVIFNYANDVAAANVLEQALSEKYSERITFIKQDLSDVKNVDPFVESVKAITASLNTIVFNVGKTDRSKPEDITCESWENVFNSNLNVPFFVIQRLLPSLVDGGSILFTGSSMGVHPHSLSLSYGVSKAAVHALVKNMVKFLAARKIRINAVVPGFVDTEWQIAKPAEIRKNIEGKIALGRFCSPEEVADACIFLIKNNYVNGETLVIDGGYNYQ